MKLVEIAYTDKESVTTSSSITEADAYQLIDQLDQVPTKSPYEFARGTQNGKLVIIYKENRIQRTKNSWYEIRGLTALSKVTGEEYIHSYKTTWKGYETEIDGITHDKTTAVELKRATINSSRLEFLSRKSRDLGFEKLVVIAPQFQVRGQEYPSCELLQFTPDWKSVTEYYQTRYTNWSPFWKLAGSRHFRFLLNNGTWKSQRRQYTTTAKWHGSQKMISQIQRFIQRGRGPVKIYYSLSRMVSPLGEYRGNGYPLELFIPVFDVDGSHEGYHIIGSQGYCQLCFNDASNKKNLLVKKLKREGYDYQVFHSGSKGFHVYLSDNTILKEVYAKGMEKLVTDNIDLVDSFLSKSTGTFDAHRIFKVPYTIDCSSGKLVSLEGIRLEFDDILLPL